MKRLIIIVLCFGFISNAFAQELLLTRYGKAITELNKAKTERERFYALNDAAKESLNAGHIQEAKSFAEELQKLMSHYQKDWNYGNAVQDVHIVFGRIAILEGRLDDAKKHLLEAGKTPGSPQLDSFGPNMTLAKELFEKGDRDTVLKYFELCSKFWEMDFDKLKEWAVDVKKGKLPDFGANLVY
jgi:tetratricopeptide (TPR) repeat protein